MTRNEKNVTRENILEAKLSYHETLFKITVVCTAAFLVLWIIVSAVVYFVSDPGEFAADMPNIYAILILLCYKIVTDVIFVVFVAAFLNLRRESRRRFASKDKILLAAAYFLTSLSGVLYIALVLLNSWFGLIPVLPLAIFILIFFLGKKSKLKALEKLSEKD